MSALFCLSSFKLPQSGGWPDRETLECALDLLSAVADSLQQQMLPLLQQRQQLLLLVERCCRDSSPPVLQSALALIGDFSKHCYCLLRPQILFPLVCKQILLEDGFVSLLQCFLTAVCIALCLLFSVSFSVCLSVSHVLRVSLTFSVCLSVSVSLSLLLCLFLPHLSPYTLSSLCLSLLPSHWRLFLRVSFLP